MTPPDWAVVVIATLSGLFVGSFLNVVAYRVPRGRSISRPRSSCPQCARQLTWWENIPVASWVALRGKCRTCASSIGSRYPVVEAATALEFGAIALAFRGSWSIIGYCLLAATVTAVVATELDGLRAPLSIAAIGTGLGAVAVLAADLVASSWTNAAGLALGAAVGVVLLGVLRARDPACLDPRWWGRTALLPAACWLGGLGARAAVAGLVAWLVVSLGCLVIQGAEPRHHAPRGGSDDAASAPDRWSLLRLPFLVGLLLALITALGVAA